MIRKDLNLGTIALSKLWKTLFYGNATGRNWRIAFMQFGKPAHKNCLSSELTDLGFARRPQQQVVEYLKQVTIN